MDKITSTPGVDHTWDDGMHVELVSRSIFELDAYSFQIELSRCEDAAGSFWLLQIDGLDCGLAYTFQNDDITSHQALLDWLKVETDYDEEQRGLFVAEVRILAADL